MHPHHKLSISVNLHIWVNHAIHHIKTVFSLVIWWQTCIFVPAYNKHCFQVAWRISRQISLEMCYLSTHCFTKSVILSHSKHTLVARCVIFYNLVRCHTLWQTLWGSLSVYVAVVIVTALGKTPELDSSCCQYAAAWFVTTSLLTHLTPIVIHTCYSHLAVENKRCTFSESIKHLEDT